MQNLRTTYLAQRRRIADSETSGKGTGEIFKTKWRFFSDLHFLGPYVKPIQTMSSLSQGPLPSTVDGDDQVDEDEYMPGDVEKDNEERIEEDVDLNPDTPAPTSSSPTPRVTNKSKQPSSSYRSKIKKSSGDLLFQASSALKSIATNRKNSSQVTLPPQEDNSDELFGKAMGKLISGITDGMNKEACKIECQQLVYKYRFSSQRQSQQTKSFPPLHVNTSNDSQFQRFSSFSNQAYSYSFTTHSPGVGASDYSSSPTYNRPIQTPRNSFCDAPYTPQSS